MAEVAAPVAAMAMDDADEEDEHALPDDVNGNVAPGENATRAKAGRGAPARPARKPAVRSRRPAKPKGSSGNS
nr:hypothetical protein [Massilia sp. Se16.2.3]